MNYDQPTPSTMQNHIINISVCKTEYNCQKCGQVHGESDYYKQLERSKSFTITKPCKRCKHKHYVTADIKGDVVTYTDEDIAAANAEIERVENLKRTAADVLVGLSKLKAV